MPNLKQRAREDKFQHLNKILQNFIAELPMTESDNNRIHLVIDKIEELFRETNNLTTPTNTN